MMEINRYFTVYFIVYKYGCIYADKIIKVKGDLHVVCLQVKNMLSYTIALYLKLVSRTYL